MVEIPDTFVRNEPVTPASLQKCEMDLQVSLRDDYRAFMLQCNGGEGVIGQGYLALWTIEELADLNRDYEVEESAPGLVVFGSDGGGEAFAFDYRDEARNYVRVPFVGMSLELIVSLGSNLEEFFGAVARCI